MIHCIKITKEKYLKMKLNFENFLNINLHDKIFLTGKLFLIIENYL